MTEMDAYAQVGADAWLFQNISHEIIDIAGFNILNNILNPTECPQWLQIMKSFDARGALISRKYGLLDGTTLYFPHIGEIYTISFKIGLK